MCYINNKQSELEKNKQVTQIMIVIDTLQSLILFTKQIKNKITKINCKISKKVVEFTLRMY